MKNYPLFKVHVPTDEALSNVREVFESGFINEGTQVTKLTNELKRVIGSENLILVNSCTSAITLALRLADVKPGDDVVSTPMTCVASNTPIVNAGANVVWADIDPMTGMLTAETIDKAITPKTKAVIVVAWAGTPPDLERINNLCHNRNVKVILDAAHAFGAEFKNKPIHSWADFTCYSFQAIKHFTTGDGGALVCAKTCHHDRAKALKWFGLDRDKTKDEKGNWKGQQWDTDVVEAGYKFNMNNIAAAIGLSQLSYIDGLLAAHRRNATLYDVNFIKTSQNTTICRPTEKHDDSRSASWVYTVLVDPNRRDAILKALNDEGIMAGLVHVPNDEYTAFKSSVKDLPGVCEFSSKQLSLPCGWWLSEDDVMHIYDRLWYHCFET